MNGSAGNSAAGAGPGSAAGASATDTGGTSASGAGMSGASGASGALGATAGATASAGSAGAAGSTGAAPVSNVLVTSAAGAYWKTGTWTESTGAATVTVNAATAYQTWEGFGGAFNELGWSYLTTQALQDQAIQLLFGSDGCHFAWGRIPIGSSDYAVDRYTLNENVGDTLMTKFSIDRDKQKLIPYIKAAQAVRSDLRFWASPWTPPTWMKSSPYQTPGNPVNAFDGGTMNSDDTTLKAHALYLIKFIQAYAAQGIAIDYISPRKRAELFAELSLGDLVSEHLHDVHRQVLGARLGESNAHHSADARHHVQRQQQRRRRGGQCRLGRRNGQELRQSHRRAMGHVGCRPDQ